MPNPILRLTFIAPPIPNALSRLYHFFKSVFALPEGAVGQPLKLAIYTGYLLLFFLLPFSIPVAVGSAEVEVPSEPLIVGVSLLLAVWFWKNGGLPRSFYLSPVSLAAFAFLGWMALMVPFSSSPLTSAKYVVVACAHAWVFYHGTALLLQAIPKAFDRLWHAYTLSFSAIILYAWTVHAGYQFRTDASVLTARPFYFDHNLYSCAMLLLAGVYLLRYFSRFGQQNDGRRWLNLGVGVFLLAGVFLGFSRGAWLSFVGAAVTVGMVAVFRLRFRVLVVAGVGISLLAGALFFQKVIPPAKPGQDASLAVRLGYVIRDVSSLERINRYSCAVRMFLDRPWTGFGPGTYQVAYLPYQLAPEMTRISVTHAGPHPPGRGGGAHSEYLQALSETGAPGALAFLALVGAAVWTGITSYRLQRDADKRLLVLGLMFGLLTFFLHGWLNNFLHSGKVAALFWAALAALNWLYADITGGSGGAPRGESLPD